MKRLLAISFAIAAALVFTPVARANTDSFGFTFSDGEGVSGSGTLYGTFEGNGEWLLTSSSIDSTFNDGTGSGAISLVGNPNGPDGASLSPSGQIVYDNLLYPWNGPAQYLTVDGLYFSYGPLELNLYQTGGGPGTDAGLRHRIRGLETMGTEPSP